MCQFDLDLDSISNIYILDFISDFQFPFQFPILAAFSRWTFDFPIFQFPKGKEGKKMEFQIVISKKRPKTFSHEYLLGIERDEVRMMAWEIEEGRLERVVPRQCYFTCLSIHPGPSIVLLM